MLAHRRELGDDLILARIYSPLLGETASPVHRLLCYVADRE